MPGKLLEYVTDFPRVVGGIDETSTRRAVELYRAIVRAPITPTDVLTAEMAKVVENAFRDVNIAFANEVALACERMGVDVYEVRALINARPDRQMHLPGSGVGGHCLPKDGWLLRYGLKTYGSGEGGHGGPPLRLIPLAREINDAMPLHLAALVAEGLAAAGREVAGARVAVLGVAYLEDSDDTRNTPALPLIAALLEQGAEVIAHDPFVRQHDWKLAWGGRPPVPLTHDLEAALEGADCGVIVTRHQEYREWADAGMGTDRLKEVKDRMRTGLLVDGRNVLGAEACRRAGIAYRGVGKGANGT
jgi:UDP-N-acetyl-D-mannosaminuronic acid dehydrogenase